MIEQMSFDEFRDQYKKKRPASVPRREQYTVTKEYADWLQWVVLAMFLTSAFLSGVHTAPTAYNTIEAAKVADVFRAIAALGTFIFVELGILVSSYLLFKKWSWFAFLILAVCLVIAMVANLYSVNLAFRAEDDFGKVVGVSFGLAAPLVAALTGKVFVNIHRSNEEALKKADQQFVLAQQAFDNEVNAAWEEYERKYAIKVEAEEKKLAALAVPPPVPALPEPKKELEPIKVKVDGKMMYTCPVCQRQMTRQAWSTHKCKKAGGVPDSATDRQLQAQPVSVESLPASNDTSGIEFSSNGHSNLGGSAR